VAGKIDELGAALRSLVQERIIVARCELLHRTYQAVRQAQLNQQERAELMKLVGSRIAPGIFSSIVSGAPIFMNFPKLDSFTVVDGRIFHFVHSAKPQKSDLQRAYLLFRESQNELLALMVQNLEDLVTEFLAEAGYRLEERTPEGLNFVKGDVRLTVLVYSRIGNVAIDQCRQCAGDHPEQCVVIVPHEESLPPFMKFFSDNCLAFEESRISVWVANMEVGSIDPFIGYTTDLDIYSRFKNPRLAAMVRSTWGCPAR